MLTRSSFTEGQEMRHGVILTTHKSDKGSMLKRDLRSTKRTNQRLPQRSGGYGPLTSTDTSSRILETIGKDWSSRDIPLRMDPYFLIEVAAHEWQNGKEWLRSIWWRGIRPSATIWRIRDSEQWERRWCQRNIVFSTLASATMTDSQWPGTPPLPEWGETAGEGEEETTRGSQSIL